MDINQAMLKCKQHNVKVYPIIRNFKFYVQVHRPDGSLLTYDKAVSGKALNEALTATYIHWANEGIAKFYQTQNQKTKE